MALRTAFTELLGLRHPIALAELAQAAARAAIAMRHPAPATSELVPSFSRAAHLAQAQSGQPTSVTSPPRTLTFSRSRPSNRSQSS